MIIFFTGGSKGSLNSQSTSDFPKVVLVFFIGGCTFAEVSALRFLSQQEDCKYPQHYSLFIFIFCKYYLFESIFSVNVEFVIATTKLINGNTFLKSVMENLAPET